MSRMSRQSRTQQLQAILEDLATGTPDIRGAALVSDDGLIIGSVLPAEADEEGVGGMAAVLLNLGSRVTGQLDLGAMEQILIRAEKGNALMVGVGNGTLLILLMRRTAKLGLIFIDAASAAEELGELI